MNKKSLLALLFSCVLIFGNTFTYPKWAQKQTEALISWDVFGYYLYLPAIFIHQDLEQLGFVDEVIKKYQPASDFHHAFKTSTGKYVMKYPIGQAIIYSPGFFISCAIAKFTNQPIDGFSPPFQIGLLFWCMFFGFIGLWFTRKSLLFYFEDTTVAISIFLFAVATNFFENCSFAVAMPHNNLFTIYAILVYATIRWYQKPSYFYSFFIGSCIAIATIMRPTEIISVLIPLLWGISKTHGWKDRLNLWQSELPKILLAVLMVLSIGSLQLIYWKLYTGSFFYYSYQEQGFSFLKPHLLQVLFSFKKGLFVYTPILIFAVWGLKFLYQNHAKIFWGIAIFLGINTYIVSSWDIWWYGGSFGMRALVQSYAILIFPFAAFISYILKQDIKKWLFFSLALFLIWLNVFQTWQAHHNEILHPTDMTRAYYWRIFGKTNIEKSDKFLLDTQDDFKAVRKNVQEIYSNDFEALTDSNFVNTSIQHSGKQSLSMDGSKTFSPIFNVPLDSKSSSANWIRVSAWFYGDPNEFIEWKMLQMTMHCQLDGKTISNRFVRVNRVMTNTKWQQVWIDTPFPSFWQNFNNIKIYFWNPGSTYPIYIDDLSVEIYED